MESKGPPTPTIELSLCWVTDEIPTDGSTRSKRSKFYANCIEVNGNLWIL